MQLENKTVVITGAARGLGFAMAERFAKHGAKIVVSDVREEAVGEAIQTLRDGGAQVHGVIADVSREEDAARLMDEAVSHFGSSDVAVLNAGILRDGFMVKVSSQTGEISKQMTLEEWQAVIDVNLTGVFLTGREAAKRMIELKNGGVIIPMASIAMHGNVGQTNYAAAKAGVAALARTWSMELARFKIRVAAIAPGMIATDMVLKAMQPAARERWQSRIPIGRLGTPDEIAHVAQFIVENELICGVVIEASGGLHLGTG